MPNLTEASVRNIVRQEIAGANDISELKAQSLRQGVLLEDLDGKMDTVLEMLVDSFGIKRQVSSHGKRLRAWK